MEKIPNYAGEDGAPPITDRAITGRSQAGMDQGPHVWPEFILGVPRWSQTYANLTGLVINDTLIEALRVLDGQ